MEAARRASLPIGSLQFSREAWTIKGEATQLRGRTIRRKFLEEPTHEWTEPSEDDHGKEEAEDARNPWETSQPEPTPSQSRPWDEDCWPQGAHA
ncbi:hypothetical protein NDU88_003435 [Pleurodeles waltl]|uniref:Uncharacterized protein n=1 Tax=Pleurodeles waltl TaxID=8319 RepID=A0AAV7REW9_PLEWA|nr:hypothetical protein NDU88_003435 [Pleurodeles waltl]